MRISTFGATHCRFVGLCLLGLAPGVVAQEEEEGVRPWRIADWTAEESIGDVVFAPDGQAVAFTRRRPVTSQISNGLAIPETRDDVWLQIGPGTPVQKVTRGANDSSGWWAPRWSPDGRRLAMLSSRGGIVQLWVWERATGRVRPVTRSGVDYAGNDFQWVDAERLIYAAMPDSVPATAMGRGPYESGAVIDRVEAAWASAKRGEVTASAVNSVEFRLSWRRVMVVNSTTGAESLVGTAQLWNSEGAPAVWTYQPKAGLVLLARPEVTSFPGNQRYFLGDPVNLELRTLAGALVSLQRPLPRNIVMSSLRWSPDSTEFVAFALEDRWVHPALLFGDAVAAVMRYPEVHSKEYPGRLWRVNVRTGRVDLVPTGDIDLGRTTQPLGAGVDASDGWFWLDEIPSVTMFWTARGELLLHAARRSKRSQADVMGVREWLVLGRNGEVHLGTASMQAGGGRAESDTMRPLSPPAADAVRKAFSPASRQGIFLQNDRTGTTLWRVTPTGPAERLVALNTHRRTLAAPAVHRIEYADQSGRLRHALLVLPHDYTSGQRVPVVLQLRYRMTDVDQMLDTTYRSPLSHVTLTGLGFAVLVAPMPLDGMRERGNNLLQFPDGVVPAVDAAIRQGLVDPERLFLYGCSNPGVSVTGLVTQTARFTAAVTACGGASSVDDLSPLGFADRHGTNPLSHLQFDGEPFWRRSEVMQRDDPYRYVDRVQTPLLLLEGDMDGGSMVGMERWFAALAQQRKPARLIRYWGEGHGNQGLANQVDWLQQVVSWFDQWGDIARDAEGRVIYDGGRAKSRSGTPPLPSEAYRRFPFFHYEAAAPAAR